MSSSKWFAALVVGSLAFHAGCSDTKSLFDPSELAGRNYPAAKLEAPSAGDFTLAPTTSVPGSIGTTVIALAAAAPISPAAPPDAPQVAPKAARQVIYSASFRVVVADVAGTIRTITQTAEKLGGYMQAVEGASVILRVPAAKFDEAVGYVEKSGEVVDRQLKAQDVTEEMRDLGIRLDNAEKLRQRLLDILSKTQKVEDALKVEAELARVAEQIDQAKGRIRYLESQIAMSTIRVDLNSAAKQDPKRKGPRLPFSWVEELGAGLVAGEVEQSVKQVGLFGRGPRFKTPNGFVRYYEDTYNAEAMDGNGLLVRVRDQANVDKAGEAFWSKLVRRSLVEGRSLAIDEEKTVDGKVYFLRGRRDVAGKPVGYMLSLERNDKRVVVFEAWGPLELFEKSDAALRDAALSVDPS